MQRMCKAGLTVLLLSIAPAFAGERTMLLVVENMSCVTCPYIVRQSLVSLPGVISVEVSFEDKTAAVTFDDTTVDLAAITAATAKAGYPSRPARPE